MKSTLKEVINQILKTIRKGQVAHIILELILIQFCLKGGLKGYYEVSPSLDRDTIVDNALVDLLKRYENAVELSKNALFNDNAYKILERESKRSKSKLKDLSKVFPLSEQELIRYLKSGTEMDYTYITLRTGLSPTGKVDDWHKFWNFIEITNFL